MAIAINDTFQVRINGQLVDCIKAEAFAREVEKNAYSIFFCDYAKICELIKLKIRSDSADKSALWIAKNNGHYINADGVTYTAFSEYDLLYTSTDDGGDSFTTLKLGNILQDPSASYKATIYSRWEDVYSIENIPKGSFVIVYTDETYGLYSKITETAGATNQDDWAPVGSSGSSIESYIDIPDKPDIYYTIRLANETDDSAITRALEEQSKTAKYGDILILKTTSDATALGTSMDISTYFYNGTIWVAASGTFDINKIIFSSDITLSGAWENVGNIKKSSGTHPAKGKSLWTIVDEIFNGTVEPTIKATPVLSIVADTTGSVEIGTSVTQNFRISLSDGKYECAGDEDTMDAYINSYSIVYGGTGESVPGEPANIIKDDRTDGILITSGNEGTFIVPENYNKKFTVYAMVKTDKNAINNKGEISSIAFNPTINTITLPDDSEQNYTMVTESAALTSYRMGAFYGPSTYKYNTDTINSDVIRSLSKLNTAYPRITTNKTFTVAPGISQLIVAVPTGSKIPEMYNETVHSPFDLTFLKTIPVMAADLTDENAADYDIYVYTPAVSFRTSNTVRVTIKP